jgi:hypothetical protein
MAGQRPTLSIREVARAGTSRNRAQARSWPAAGRVMWSACNAEIEVEINRLRTQTEKTKNSVK